MERTKDMMDTAAKYLRSSPNVMRKNVAVESDEDDGEQLIDRVPADGEDDIGNTDLTGAEWEAAWKDKGDVSDSSFRAKMKKKMGKLSLTSGADGRKELGSDSQKSPRKLSPADLEPTRKSPLLARLKPKFPVSPIARRGSGSKGEKIQSPIDDLSSSYEGYHNPSLNNSTEDLDQMAESDNDFEGISPSPTALNCPSLVIEGEVDDVVGLGPGQVCPRLGADAASNGDLKLGLIMTKGQCEVHIMCARGLAESTTTNQAPDTYVKTYLTDTLSKKRTSKKKTKIVKGSCEPMYRQKTKYAACDVYKRQLIASVWEKCAVLSKEKNQCIGELTIELDELDLNNMNTAWYKLFRRSSESGPGGDSDSDTMNAY